MLLQDSFKTHFVGRDGFIWWIGQIASDSWEINTNLPSTAKPVDDEEYKGFGYRYQVRIMGYHTADDSENGLKDADLPWATVMYPVTAGAGNATLERPTLRQGSFVYGFFLDGEDAQQPVIMGVFGYNQYTTLANSNPNLKPFTPFKGYKRYTGIEPAFMTKDDGKVGEGATQPGTKGTAGTNTGDGVDNSNAVGATNKENKDGKKKENIDLPDSCKKSKSPGAIQKDIQNMIENIRDAKQGLKDFRFKVMNPIEYEGSMISIQQYVQIQIDKTSQKVTGWIKDRVEDLYAWVVRKINKALKSFYFMLFPDKASDTKAAVDTAMDLLACQFRRLIKNLLNMVRKALLQVVDRYIRVPLCAAENILASILGKIMGFINGVISAIMAPLEAIFGIVGIVGDIMGFLEQILGFLSCDEEPDCPEVDSSSFWDGPQPPRPVFDVDSLMDKIKGFTSSVSSSLNPDNFDFDLDFSDIMDNDCNVGPILCGPPKVVFWGGGGQGATGNAIVSTVGEILGIDIINSGWGYDRKPFISFVDDCGRGRGGVSTPDLGPVSPEYDDNGDPIKDENGNPIYTPDPNGDEIGVTGIVVDDPGFDYRPVPDGAKGGDGWTFSDPDQTTVMHGDSTWDTPYNPDEPISVTPGDTINTPTGSETPLICDTGQETTVYGGSSYVVQCNGQLTAPRGVPGIVPGNYPLKNEEYPVILYICGAIINDPGFNYKEGDKVVIEPDNGAVIEPTFGPFGDLTSLKVTSSGEGFQEMPKVYIQSETGFNARITLKLCIDRIGEDRIKEPGLQDKLVSVIDCVGTLTGGITKV